MQTTQNSDDWTWCPRCKQFRPGRGPCPVCGNRRNGYQPVRLGLYDRQEQFAGDPGYHRR